MFFKRVLAGTMAVLCCGVVSTTPPRMGIAPTSLTASAATYAYSGSCGDDATYSFDTATGTLTISGTGYISKSPWNNYNSSIKNVIIEDGITRIIRCTFMSCENL